MKTIRSADVDIAIIGRVVEGTGSEIIINGEARDFTPRFRESAYTPIKKMIGDEKPRDFDDMKKAIDKAALIAMEKKRRVIEMIKRK
jgi:hydrogenase expression/formation protein